jgi:hypothetical protein
MNKDDWRAFLRWLETASNGQIETAILRVDAASMAFRQEGPQEDARKMIGAMQIELEARQAVGQ